MGDKLHEMNQSQLIIMGTNTADNITRNGIPALIGHSCWALIDIQYYLKSFTLLRNEENIKNLTETSKRL